MSMEGTVKEKPATKKQTFRREDIPGYSTSRPDMSNWKEAAAALRVRPFYEGPDSVPFSRLRAFLVPDPTRGKATINYFYQEH
jgi:hypothetical protein